MLLHDGVAFPKKDILQSNNLGISSGASAPEILIQNLIKEIAKLRKVKIEEISTAVENITFKLPSNLK
jgi:Penicillin tolerance protein